MIRNAAGKVMWVGRATVFLVGLAVILALLFGAASAALAHGDNKGFFDLGHKNVTSKVSKLIKRRRDQPSTSRWEADHRLRSTPLRRSSTSTPTR